MDFVQMRWLQVRAFEQQQAVEKENLQLRKQILELKAMNQENSGSHKQALYTFSKFLLNWFQREKQNLQSIRSAFCMEIEKNKSDSAACANALKKLQLKFKDATNDNLKLTKENIEMRSELEKLKREGSDAVSSKSQELAKLRSQINNLQEEIRDLESSKNSLSQKNESLKSELEQYAHDKSVLSSKFETSHGECKRLRSIINKLEIDHSNELATNRLAYDSSLEKYLLALTELKNQNDKMKAVIMEQEEEIERLNKSLHGNRSHFAKFVELKEQNVALSAKLKSVLSEVPAYDPIGAVFTGGSRVPSVPNTQPKAVRTRSNSSGPRGGIGDGAGASENSQLGTEAGGDGREVYVGSGSSGTSAKRPGSAGKTMRPTSGNSVSNMNRGQPNSFSKPPKQSQKTKGGSEVDTRIGGIGVSEELTSVRAIPSNGIPPKLMDIDPLRLPQLGRNQLSGNDKIIC